MNRTRFSVLSFILGGIGILVCLYGVYLYVTVRAGFLESLIGAAILIIALVMSEEKG